ncbi:MAG TPA: dicarboxylate/amino acid:cation symporter [Candidatus Krumholzibacteria bacterium]|nr:dicarboxylate/amino acid:cation symporter [Candidatus Krumholzibacteria bacterium]
MRNGGPWYRQLHWQIFIAMALGAAVGAVGGESVVPSVSWLGTLFIRLLKMIIVPLIIFSIISGVASVAESGRLGRLFARTFGYYMLSSLLAILVGLALVNIIQPGTGANLVDATSAELPQLETPSSVLDIINQIIPENVVAALARPDMLAVIFFCILFGAAIAALPESPRRAISGFFDSGFQAMMKLTGWIIALAPLGVFGLIARMVGETGFASFRALGLYMVTIAVALTIHLFVVLPLLLLLLGRIDPRVHFRNMMEPLAVAFSTSSSGATLPVTLRTVEEKVGVSNRISSFVLPMGATVNMDGTALYECAGVLFISQVLGFELGVGQQLVVVLTALLASVGAAAVPSAGLVIIFLVLESVGLRGPEVNAIVGMMLAIDRPLDMYRTAVNVYSDSCGAAIIARGEGETGVDVGVRAPRTA